MVQRAVRRDVCKAYCANQESNQVTNQVSLSKHRLTKEEKDIVNFCSIPRTAQEILDRVGVSVQTRTRKKYILPLVEMGVLEMTIPENPNDRNQKYRKKRRSNLSSHHNDQYPVSRHWFLRYEVAAFMHYLLKDV